MIRSHGGIFGRNPAFQNVEVQGALSAAGTSTTENVFGVNGKNTNPVTLWKYTGDNPSPFNNPGFRTPFTIATPETPNYPSVGSSGLPGNVMFTILNSSVPVNTFSVLDNGDVNCSNISMSGYLAPTDAFVSGKVWANTYPNNTLANGPYFWLKIPTTGDTGDFFLVSDENDNPYVQIDNTGYATFSAGTQITNLLVVGTISFSGIVQGVKSLLTTSTATNTTLRWSTNSKSLKFVIQARNNFGTTLFQLTEIVATHNDVYTTIASQTMYNINTGAVVATYAIDIVGTEWRLKITPTVSSTTYFTVYYTSFG